MAINFRSLMSSLASPVKSLFKASPVFGPIVSGIDAASMLASKLRTPTASPNQPHPAAPRPFAPQPAPTNFSGNIGVSPTKIPLAGNISGLSGRITPSAQIPQANIGPTIPSLTTTPQPAPTGIINQAPATQAQASGVVGTQVASSQGQIPSPFAPTIPSITTQSGAIINPSTGGVASPAAPAIPTTAPVQPTDRFTSPGYEAALRSVESNIQPTEEEQRTQEELDRISSSLRTAFVNTAGQTIPLEFITGQKKAQEERALAFAEPLQTKAARLQAKRLASLEASKTRLAAEEGRLSAITEANKPVSVAAGTALINPLTGRTVAEGPSLSEKQSLDTFYNLAQTYPDAGINWDSAKTAQQNLASAQQQAANSPSFQARNTVYAINPLTGEPQIVSKMGGARGGIAPGISGGVSTANLAPELKSALNTVGDIQYFDASKVTNSQLPFLQRASQTTGVPLLTKEDANKVQESYQSFSSANALVDQIKDLTASVITAPDNAGAQSIQAARLKAIELAPSLSTDNDAKQFISARNSVLSLLSRATGEKGVLTDQDIKRISQALPSYSDSATLADQKANNLSNILNSVLRSSIGTYIGSGTKGINDNDPLGLF